MKEINRDKRLDLFGVSASLLCAAHCSILPLAIGSGILSTSFFAGHTTVEFVFIIVSIFLASASLFKSYNNNHRDIRPLSIFVVGISMVGIGLLYHGVPEIILATGGGIIIAISHLWNIKLNQKANINLSL